MVSAHYFYLSDIMRLWVLIQDILMFYLFFAFLLMHFELRIGPALLSRTLTFGTRGVLTRESSE